MKWKYGLTDENVNELIDDVAKTLFDTEDLGEKTSTELEDIIKGVLYDDGWKYGLYAVIGEPFITDLVEELMGTDNLGDLTDEQIKEIIRGIATTNWA